MYTSSLWIQLISGGFYKQRQKQRSSPLVSGDFDPNLEDVITETCAQDLPSWQMGYRVMMQISTTPLFVGWSMMSCLTHPKKTTCWLNLSNIHNIFWEIDFQNSWLWHELHVLFKFYFLIISIIWSLKMKSQSPKSTWFLPQSASLAQGKTDSHYLSLSYCWLKMLLLSSDICNLLRSLAIWGIHLLYVSILTYIQGCA